MSASVSKADFLAYFWDLASEEQDRRLKSSRDIVSYILSLPSSPTSIAMSTDSSSSSSGGGITNQSDDADYTLKRLIRGLSSSREAARQGFSTCLCEILKLPRFDINDTMSILEDSTKLASATKGSEERDMMFGKLFGYMAIIRSGRIHDNAAMVSDLFEKVISLLSTKTWIRELVCECIIIILHSFDSSITKPLISKLSEFFPESLNIFEAWQLMLGLGLEFLRSDNHDLKEEINKVLPQKKLLNVETFTIFESCLLASTFGFPKIHRVWDFILGKIFGFDIETRTLPSSRVPSLGSSQLDLLKTLCRFIDSDMIFFSNEKRGVALKLVSKMLAIVPADLIPVALTPGTVACLMKVRRPIKSAPGAAKSSKHLLYSLAGSVIHEMVAVAAKSDPVYRLALASVIVQHNGANFDNITGIAAVQSMLTDLDEKSIESYLTFLISTLAPQNVHTRANALLQMNEVSNKSNSEMDADGEGAKDEDANDDYNTICEKNIMTSIDALVSLCSNHLVSHRAYVCSIASAVLMRIGIFETTVIADSKSNKLAFQYTTSASDQSSVSTTKSAKKDKKKDKDKGKEENDNLFGVSKAAIDKLISFLAILEGTSEVDSGIFKSSSASDSTPSKAKTSTSTAAGGGGIVIAEFSESVKSYAASKLLSILADTAKLPSSASASASSTASSEGDAAGTDSLLTLYLSTLYNLVTVHKLPIRMEVESNDQDGEGGGASAPSPVDVSMHCLHIIQGLTNQLVLKSRSSSGDATPFNQTAIGKLVGAFSDYLSYSLFHVIATNDVPILVLMDAIICGQQIFGYEISIDVNMDEDAADQSEEEKQDAAYISLFDTCMEVLSIPAENSLKGVKHAIMRIWNSLAAITSSSSGHKHKHDGSSSKIAPVSEVVILSIVEAAIGEDVEKENGDDIDGEDGSEVEEEEGSDDDDDDDEEVNDVDEDEDRNSKKKSLNISIKDSKNRKIGGGKQMDISLTPGGGEEKEDILIDNGQLMNMMENDFDFETEGGMLEHTAEADGALSHMLETQKSQRKAAIMQRQRVVYLIRTRALGILEIMLNKEEDTVTLLSCLSPLISCLRIVSKSSVVGSINEGRAFAQKLSSIIDQKICKKKFSLVAEEGEEIDLESFRALMAAVESDLLSNSASMAPLRFVSSQCFLCLARPSFSNCSKEVSKLLASIASNLFVKYINSKSNKIPVKLLDELISKYPDFVVPLTLDVFIEGCGEKGRSTFLKTEAARFLSEFFRKYRNLEVKSQGKLISNAPAILNALLKFFGESIGNSVSDSVQLPTKRLKTIISSIKEMVSVLVFVQSTEPIRISEGVQSAVRSLDGFIKTSLSSKGAKLGQSNEKLVENVSASLVKLLAQQQQQTAKSKDGAKGGSKDSGSSSSSPSHKNDKKREIDTISDGKDNSASKKHSKSK